MVTVRFPCQQFRNLPAPAGTSRIGVFYTPASTLPRDLWDWREVNPREVNDRSAVYKAIFATLTQESERFHERNRGITLVAHDLTYDEKRKEAVAELVSTKAHGVVDGAHTLHAILEAQRAPQEGPWSPYVFVKVITGVEADQIAEIAGGLNTSQQVDLKSLENLRDHFDRLKRVLAPEPYANLVAYKMNEDKPVDVREVLYYLAVFDRSEYDDRKHPVALFGRKEGIVRRFADQARDPAFGDSFDILISRAPEILRLRDRIEQRLLALDVGRFNFGKGVRIRSDSNKENVLVFLNETVNGKIPLGWVLPILAAFRANVEWNKPKGSFSWTVPNEELIEACIETLLLGIGDVHSQEGSRPELVGRNPLAWRMSYSTVSQAILGRQLDKARQPAGSKRN